MRNFYSGISNDKTQFLINMNWYKDNDVEACFNHSKIFHGLAIHITHKKVIKVKGNQLGYIKSRCK